MELKPGYKQTEVGVIPEDWEVAKLGERATFRTGPFGSALHKSDYTNDGVPVINPMHIIDGHLQPTRTMTVTDRAASRLLDFRLRRGDVIIGRRGDMGRCAVVDEGQTGWLCGTGSLIVRCAETVDPGFLGRVLSSPSVVAAIEDASVGSTMVNLNQGVLDGLRLQFPPLQEQRAIATALDDVDALLGALEKLITKKRDLKQAAMQRLLTGRTRLPGFHGQWEIRELGQLGTWKGGATPSMSNPAYWVEGEVMWATSGDIKTSVLTETVKSITRKAVLESSTTLLEPGAILIVTRSGILRRYLPVAINAVPVAINQDIKALVPDEGVSPAFVLQALLDQGPSILASCLKAGTTVESVEYIWLKRHTITLPTEAEQAAIVAVLSDMDAEIAALEARLAKTRALKRGMIHGLLTGRIRLPVTA